MVSAEDTLLLNWKLQLSLNEKTVYSMHGFAMTDNVFLAVSSFSGDDLKTAQ